MSLDLRAGALQRLASISALMVLTACSADPDVQSAVGEQADKGADRKAIQDPKPAATLRVNGNSLLVSCSPPSARTVARPEGRDPLFGYQWYLKNVGQQVFADHLPCPGVDLNMGALLTGELGNGGSSVTVAVIEETFQLDHPDLIGNVSVERSHNYAADGAVGDTPDEHATQVAGVVAARGGNGIGLRGVAPNATLVSLNPYVNVSVESPIVEQDSFRTYFGQAWGEGKEARGIDVFNNSLGLASAMVYRDLSHSGLAEWENIMASSRRGLGGVYVVAGGNHFNGAPDAYGDDISIKSCLGTRYKLGCEATQLDYFTTFIDSITVGAVNASGVKSSYSTTGSSLWVVAPAGERGLQRAYNTVGEPADYGPGIVTTDLTGCDRGDNADSEYPANALSRANALAPRCEYTANFGGSSAAAPMVSGVAALMLDVHDRLTQREVKYILAATARPLDLDRPAARYKNTLVEHGWITNKAGYRFSNWYGFGLVDAQAAVNMALDMKRPDAFRLPKSIDSGWRASTDPAAIIGDHASPARMTIDIDKNVTVEAVQFGLNTTHLRPRWLSAKLISPQGTESHVLTPLSGLRDMDDLPHPDFSGVSSFRVPVSASNAFFGEQARGTWTLEIIDLADNPSHASLTALNLRIVGH